MDFLKSIFGDKALTFADLETALKDNKDIKLANLATGNYVDKEKFDKAELKAKEIETQLGQANTTIKGFKDLDVEGLKNGIKTWEDKYKTDTEALTQKLTKQTLDSKIEVALLGAKAKNTKATKALLNFENIKLDGDNVVGLDEQIKSLTKENPFLFGEVDKNPPPGGGKPPMGDSFGFEFATVRETPKT